ncbi:MAG: SPOR domain-containing protein [Pseudomonadota bacterium]
MIVPRAQAPGEDPDQPRRVRTLIVNPDGSIVRAPAVEAAPSTTAAVQPAPSSPEPAAPAVQPQPATVPNDATITEDANQPAEPETAVPVEPVAPVVPTETAEPEIAVEGDPSIPVPLSRPAGIRPQAASQPQAPVTRQTASAPRSISPPAVAQTAGSGPFVVQLASRRSQEQALSTYASLQNQFPGILGAYTPIIERADLGSRGVFYRLRVGPLGSQTAAANLCGQLRSAGLNDCLVQRN